MIHALLPLLLLVQSSPGADETVARLYDLSGLFVAADEGLLGDQAFPLLSLEREDLHDWERTIDRDLPRAILRELLAGDFEAKGVEVEDAGDARLIVRAAPAVHQRVQAAMAAVDRALSAALDLELCVLRLPEVSDVRAGVVPAAQAEAWIEAAARDGGLERFPLRVGRGTAARAEVGRQSSFLGDYDVEVAEGALCFDPVVFQLCLGTSVTARAALGRGGHFLALSMRRASAVGDLRRTIVERHSALLASDALLATARRVAHESQPVLGRSFALNAFLPDGSALVVLLEHGTADVREAVVVRAVGGGLSAPPALTGGPRGRSLQLLDTTHWAPPLAVGNVRGAFDDGRARFPGSSDHDWVVRVGTASSGEDEVETLERALNLTHGSRDADEGFWPLRAVALGEQAPRLLAELEAFAPQGTNVTAGLVLRRGGQVVARVEAPLRVGVASDVVLCSEDLYVGEADVEIAKYAALEDPVLRERLEGLLASLRPLRTPAGDVLLELHAAGVVPAGTLRSLEVGDGASGRLEEQAHAYLWCDERLRFGAGGGSRTVRVGDAGGGLALDVTLSGL